MTSKEQQVKNSFIYLVPVVVGNAIPVVTLPIFTRILTTEDYGAFGLAQVYAIFITGLANFGLTITYERDFFQYEDPKRAAQLLYSIFGFVFLAFATFGVVTWLFRVPIASWLIGSSGQSELLFWTFCATAMASLKAYYLTYFRNTGNARAVAIYTIDETLLGTVLSLFMIVVLHVGVMGLVWGPFVASLVVFASLAFKFLGLLPFSFSPRVLMDALKLSYPLTPRIFLGVVSNQLNKYMIGIMASVGGVGIYGIGDKLATLIFTYMTALQGVFVPQTYKKMFALKEEGGASVGRYLTPFAYISVALALVIALFSQEMVTILTPPSYHAAIDIAMVLAIYYCSLFFGKLAAVQLIYAKKTFATSVLTLVTIALNAVIGIPFVMAWGAIGAAWATLLSGLIAGIIAFFAGQRYYQIKWEYKRLAAIFLTFISASLLVLIAKDANVPYLLLLLAKLVFLLVFAYIGVKVQVITADNLLLLKNMLVKYRATLPRIRTGTTPG